MLWNWLSKKINQSKVKLQEEDDLLLEIEQAKREWQQAHEQLDHAVGKEQIDYAIFALEAAEKRYEMLLKQVKDLQRQGKTKSENISLDQTIQKGETPL